MINIVTAIGCPNINYELRELNKYNIISNDIDNIEKLYEIIKHENVDKLILYENCIENLGSFEIIENINNININIEIIYICDNNNNLQKKRLNGLGVYKIICADELSIEKVVEKIENEKLKNINASVNYTSKTESSEYINNCIIKDKIITVFGNPCSGKTTVATNLAIELAKSTKNKVLLFDFDILNANIDVFLNLENKVKKDLTIYIDQNKCNSLNYCVELIDKEIFNEENFKNILIEYENYKNLFVLTGNTSMFVCQNILKDFYYKKILETAKLYFDYIIIDVNSSVFFDATKYAIESAEKIMYVVEPTLKEVKIFWKTINFMSNSWKINKEKISIIINKYSKKTLGDIKDYFLDIPVQEVFEYDDEYIECLNVGVPIVLKNEYISRKFKKILGIYLKDNGLFQFRKYLKEVLVHDYKSI